jgi:hypothetical protein
VCLSRHTRKCTVLAQAHWELHCARASTLGVIFCLRKHPRSCIVLEEAHSELYVLAQAHTELHWLELA